MFFRFPPDARRNPDRNAVEFGIGVGEYEGVVRVSWRVFQILVPETLTPERCLEAFHLRRTRFELIAERKASPQAVDRGRQCRDHRPRSSRARRSTESISDRLSSDRSMKAAQQAAREAERRFPVRVRIAVPPEGLGNRHDQMTTWLAPIVVPMGGPRPHRAHDAS
jgi:hypothetical protein